MDLPYLINLLQNKFNYLNNARSAAAAVGDLNGVISIEQEILTTQNTLAQLQLLLSATQAAATTDSDLATVVAAGVQSAQASMNVPDAPTAILASYDLSTYAADPLYIQKITDILSVMPAMDTTAQIDAYIANEVIGSPLTGAMILDATTNYNVDTRLTMAIMELDSQFGTAGVAVSTMNPGNVGNTGTTTKTFDSWAIGVAAVAAWLGNHRVVVAITPVTDSVAQTSTSTPTTSATSTATTSSGAAATTTTPINTSAATTSGTVSTSTPPVNATSTPDFNLGNSTSTPDTSTTATSTTTPTVASTTPSTVDLSGLPSATSTPDTSTTATSTPPVPTPVIPPVLDATTTPTSDSDATSTQAYNWFGGVKGKRRKV